MKVKVRDLSGAALDWAVATCEGLTIVHDPMGFKSGSEAGYWIWDKTPVGRMEKIGRAYSPTTRWEQGGPIIEREGICIRGIVGGFHAWYSHCPPKMGASRMLVAAMLCYVAKKLGEEIEVPQELL